MANWSREELLDLSTGYRPAAVLLAAAELELFDALIDEPLTASSLAKKLGCGLRGMTILMDALTALELLEKREGLYFLCPGTEAFLTAAGSQSILAMLQHRANLIRLWGHLARVVKTGQPAERTPSIRGEAGDFEAFIGAMDNVSAPQANQVIQAIQPLDFRHLLDIGGASGTWTMAFLRACPSATATLFDQPSTLPMARRRLEQGGMTGRVRLVAGDFLKDALPRGADLAWVSAVVHQYSRRQNRLLFANVFRALEPAGRIAIRDVVMDPTRTCPVTGALFAVNMLIGTPEGGTFTYEELREDLEATGFIHPTVVRRDEGMNSILVAEKPASEVGRDEKTR